MTVRRGSVLCVLAVALLATVPAFGQSTTTKTLLTLSGSKTASVSVAIKGKFSLRGLDVTTTGTFAGYEMKDRHGAVVAWGVRLPSGQIMVQAAEASLPAGTYQVTLLTDGTATVRIKAFTAASPKTLRPRTHADFTFASATVSTQVEGVARLPFTVPERYGLVVHIVALTRGVDVAAYENDCITTDQLCEVSTGPRDVSPLPAGVGGSDGSTSMEDYRPGDLAPGATNAVVEYVAASETASATSAIMVFF